MPRWSTAPPCGMAAVGWGAWEVRSPRGDGQRAAVIAEQGVELEQELGDSQTVQALCKLLW